MTGEMVSNLLSAPPESSLTTGQWGIWEMHVTGIAGDFAVGRFPAATAGDQGASAETFSEGEPQTVEHTKY
ncbi:hypothetical protein [Rhizobium laguerreae]|uniref:hypothetical protein n=1 Tax=Rhizobium laguerreae TaxID=1076926 RepID=UPI001C9263F7|nr:hypothetical protein [Rhizobium laguerreae]